MTLPIPQALAEALGRIPELQQAFFVGGCVRDALLGVPVKDFDLEVFGVTYAQLAAALRPWGRVDLVGRSFGVIKFTTPDGRVYDLSLPRRDSKTAPGHKGFQVVVDPDITLIEAAARRDFTLNALMFDPRRQEVLDFFEGQTDLRQRVLRHTSPAFVEDPLRVLRGMQFAARFELQAAPETIALCRRIKGHYRELPAERVREEWFKWAGQSRRPSAGLRFLEATEWLEHFPEIAALRGTPQDPHWHPEGDVFTHTCHSLDALVELPAWLAADTESRIVYTLAVLGHDFAKPQTTKRAFKHGRWCVVSPGHEDAGGPLVETFLARFRTPESIRQRVVPLVTHHLAHLQQATDRSVRRLALRLAPETIDGLSVVITADAFGRPPKRRQVPPGLIAFQAKAAELALAAAAPKPILQGRHLIALGMNPGKEMGVLLAAAFEAQLEGGFSDLESAKRWALDRLRDLGVPAPTDQAPGRPAAPSSALQPEAPGIAVQRQSRGTNAPT